MKSLFNLFSRLKKATIDAQCASQLIVLVFVPLAFTHSYSYEGRKSVITDPAISSRCEGLGKERLKRVNIKQKWIALRERNKRLQKKVPKNRSSVKKKLEANLIKVNNELNLALLKIDQIEEEIIRKGCPGIRF